MNQDTSYYAIIHGEHASLRNVNSIYSPIARIIDCELNVVRNSDQPMWSYISSINLINEDLPPNPYDLRVQPELAFKEREKLLRKLFGGGEFGGFIGEVGLYHGRVPQVKEEAMFRNRISKLTLSLRSELSRWTSLSQSPHLSDTIRKDIEPHITHLSSLPFGPQLLHAIGYIYVSKAREWMADNAISTKMFARFRNRKPEWQRVREMTVEAIGKFSDEYKDLESMICNGNSYGRFSQRDYDVSIQYSTLFVLSHFLKMVWLGTLSDIESVLDPVCEKAIKHSSKPKRTAKVLEAYGKCLRQAYQRSSRRRNSVFYWEMFSCTGEDSYWLDSGYSEYPERVTARNGQMLLPDTARYEYVEYGIGDPSNLWILTKTSGPGIGEEESQALKDRAMQAAVEEDMVEEEMAEAAVVMAVVEEAAVVMAVEVSGL